MCIRACIRSLRCLFILWMEQCQSATGKMNAPTIQIQTQNKNGYHLSVIWLSENAQSHTWPESFSLDSICKMLMKKVNISSLKIILRGVSHQPRDRMHLKSDAIFTKPRICHLVMRLELQTRISNVGRQTMRQLRPCMSSRQTIHSIMRPKSTYLSLLTSMKHHPSS